MRVERAILWHVTNAVSQLAKTAKNSSAVGLFVTSFIAHSEFDCEPIDSCKAAHFQFRSSERCKPYFLREICEFLVGEHWCVTKKFVQNIRFWCVHWLRMVANILSRAKDSERKRI